ncbi:M20 family metallopeptidase [Mycolicibacterium goodii]|uniref:M20 family metallopeptidase n=1 Tax=Mycolicibacterium goodii TaxID=134601 RepID=UPI001BDC8F2B|nr:M20 family metallopeptidase [Mycolicibacterium goodii]MBU8809804.1 M20 family metallopeptidase [Mycolicibacterium goodii]MBU8819430.1 M20 family metallopeptidase [Mycolicibacterium goodii]ULN49980.1 M20 family metallopeptidase [Mycolicibacterium goodii]
MGVSAAEQEVLDRLDESLVVDLTVALVQAAGENPPGEEAATVRALCAAAADLGLDVTETEVEPGRNNVRVRLNGGAGPGLLMLGHTDVVPVGAGWTTDPFGGVRRDGRIYGRGAADMKGGLAAALSAMAALRSVTLRGPIELAALVDEEENGKGVRAYVDAHLAADVDTANQRYLGCITAEPTDLQTIIGARGASYVRVQVRGKACHAGNPDDGANAIYGAAAAISEIERLHAELADRPHPLLGAATWSVGQVQGGTAGAIVPDECVVIADRRLLPGESGAAVVDDLRARLAGLADRGLTVEVSMPMEMPPFQTSADADLVRIAESALSDAGGPGLPVAGWTAACDGGFIARDLGVPVVVLGPGSVTDEAHRADESVPVDQLVVAARTYVLTALRLLG